MLMVCQPQLMTGRSLQELEHSSLLEHMSTLEIDYPAVDHGGSDHSNEQTHITRHTASTQCMLAIVATLKGRAFAAHSGHSVA